MFSNMGLKIVASLFIQQINKYGVNVQPTNMLEIGYLMLLHIIISIQV